MTFFSAPPNSPIRSAFLRETCVVCCRHSRLVGVAGASHGGHVAASLLGQRRSNNATALAEHRLTEDTAHRQPVSNSIPLVTLAATPSNLAKRSLTPRNATDGSASTTHPAPSIAASKSGSTGMPAGSSTPDR